MALSAGDTSTWTAAVDGDWNDTGNWSPAEVPVDQVHLYFPESASQGPDENLDQSARDFRSLFSERDSTYDIGQSGNPLKCTVDNTDATVPSINHRGSGTLYYNCESTGVHNTGTILIRSPNRDAAAVIGGDTIFAFLVVAEGRTEVLASYQVNIPNIFVTQWSGASVESRLILGTSSLSPSVTALVHNAGIVEAHRGVSLLIQSGGFYTQATYGVGQLFLSGGTHNMDTLAGMTDGYLLGGTLDTTGTGYAKTISHLYHMPRATLITNERTTITDYFRRTIFGEDVE
ncbi:MAG: hypothetical protein KAV00_02040 [Phycisphaerae bacterium]|nr:hypothetical protein [Phycisphaerae bacterium]